MLRRLLPYLFLGLIPLVVLEAFGLAGPWLFDDLYDHRDRVFAQLDERQLATSLVRYGDPVLGWARVASQRTSGDSCEGKRWIATYDAEGARVYPGYDPERVEIVAVGDSYTAGAEVDDADAYPAQLAAALGVGVANHGVGGYGPVQSFLNLKATIDRHPTARIVVLGIMYENVYRMVNSYRPVLSDRTSMTYGLQPYMAGGAIVPHPGAAALHDVSAFMRHAAAAFDTDFWAKPRHRFPYGIALLRGLGANYFWLQELRKSFRKLGMPEYFLAFRWPAITRELRALLNQYAGFAKSRGLVPIAVFIPNNRDDIASASHFIEANRPLLDPDLVLGDVGEADIAWQRFSLEEPDGGDFCHPAPYGYREIAEHVAAMLQDAGLIKPRLARPRGALTTLRARD